MESYFSLKINYKDSDENLRALELAARISKNIYNVSLYIIRQEYFKTKKLIPIGMLYREVRKNNNYKYLNKSISDAAISYAYGCMKTFIASSNKEKENDFPRYKGKLSRFQLSISKPVIQNENGNKIIIAEIFNHYYMNNLIEGKFINDELLEEFVKIANLKKVNDFLIKIPDYISDKEIINIKFKPALMGMGLVFAYKDKIEYPKTKAQKLLAIDLGVSNLATCVTTDLESFIIDGKNLKSIIRLYDKNIACLNSQLEKDKFISKRIICNIRKKNNRIEDYLNKAVKLLFNKVEEMKVDTIIIGWNENFKQTGIKNDSLATMTKKRINQMFVGIPLARFRDKIKNKAKRLGIRVEIVEESYTSKASFFEEDSFNSKNFSGLRIERGLYQRQNGMFINADVNGALNIYRKYCYSKKTRYKLDEMIKKNKIPDPIRIRVKI